MADDSSEQALNGSGGSVSGPQANNLRSGQSRRWVRRVSAGVASNGVGLHLELTGDPEPEPMILSWPRAKLLAEYLAVLVAQHEDASGPVDLHPQDAAVLLAMRAEVDGARH